MPPRVLTLPTRAGRSAALRNGILYPLDKHYARLGVAPPVARRTSASRIPSPYHGLLVHENEMTQTLERHVGGPVGIRVMSIVAAGPWYSRRVLMVEELSARPVAMGAVRIRLDAFSARIRARILRQQAPLGRILREAGVQYVSRPTAFFEVTPNAEMMGVFRMPEARTLYGRQTQLMLGDAKVGDLVEILPLV
jgi:chorismate-pyruvate lyase